MGRRIAAIVFIFLCTAVAWVILGSTILYRTYETDSSLRSRVLAQLVYLILFSYAFFFKGFTGLTITIGSITTLFVVMQMTGRIRWVEKLAGKSVPATSPRST